MIILIFVINTRVALVQTVILQKGLFNEYMSGVFLEIKSQIMFHRKVGNFILKPTFEQ